MTGPIPSVAKDRVQRLLGGYGLIEARYDHCVQATADKDITKGRSDLREKGRVSDPLQALEFLSPYTFPATRHILFPAGDSWTAAVSNSKNGSDFNDDGHCWTDLLHVRTIRVVDRASVVWKQGSLRVVMGYECRILELLDRGGGSRNINCANDGGRWTWQTSGTPHPVEAAFDYGAKRIKDRFTRDNLKAFLASLSIPAVDAEAFMQCKSFSLIEEIYRNADWQARILSASCTEAELLDPAHGFYQRGMGWVGHMTTHASSVIADFEKALQINPAYEPRVRKYLNEAYRLVQGS